MSDYDDARADADLAFRAYSDFLYTHDRISDRPERDRLRAEYDAALDRLEALTPPLVLPPIPVVTDYDEWRELKRLEAEDADWLLPVERPYP
jgi:hypothetical protein